MSVDGRLLPHAGGRTRSVADGHAAGKRTVSRNSIGRYAPCHTFANSAKYMIRDKARRSESATTVSTYRRCRANASFPSEPSISARWASMPLSLPLALKRTLRVKLPPRCTTDFNVDQCFHRRADVYPWLSALPAVVGRRTQLS